MNNKEQLIEFSKRYKKLGYTKRDYDESLKLLEDYPYVKSLNTKVKNFFDNSFNYDKHDLNKYNTTMYGLTITSDKYGFRQHYLNYISMINDLIDKKYIGKEEIKDIYDDVRFINDNI